MPHIDTQYRLFIVGERPFCYWDNDISKEVSAFLDSLDTSYFESMANVLIAQIEESPTSVSSSISHKMMERIRSIFQRRSLQPECDPQHAAIALRMIYSQALETLFALICASVQAPRCAHAWMFKYSPSELRQLIQKIEDRQSFPWQLRATTPSWYVISDFIHMSLVLEDKEKEGRIKRGFSRFWSRLASDFVKQPFTDEYNSIKHGFRVRIGGFSFAIGREDQPGVPAPKDRMQLIGKSEYGSSFMSLEQIGEHNIHYQMKRSSRNWSPTDIAWALHLVSMSLENIVGGLRILNGTPAEDVRFQWPDDIDTFSEPWKRSMKLGITSMTGFGNQIHPSLIEPFTRDEILSRYSSGNDGGVTRRSFSE